VTYPVNQIDELTINRAASERRILTIALNDIVDSLRGDMWAILVAYQELYE
jgi:hypothetical protein